MLYEATNGAQSANVDANAIGRSAIAFAKKYAAVFKPVEHSRQYCAVSQPNVDADVAAASATKINTFCGNQPVSRARREGAEFDWALTKTTPDIVAM